MKRSNRLMHTLVLLGVFCSSAYATVTYYTYLAPTVEYEVPFASNFKAYHGETVTFRTIYKDPDKKVDDSTCPKKTEYYTGSPFKQHWTISGKGSFSSSDSDVTTKDTDGLESGNVYVYIGSGFSGSDSITVSVTLDDNSTNSPGSDNDGDSAHSKSWTITVKDKCPTSLACFSPSPCTGDKSAPATYGYLLNPDIAPAGRPDYEGISIHESFGSITSNIDKNVHVTELGRTLKPTWGNDEWRDYYFGTPSGNSTFTPDASDVIVDQHAGFSSTMAFLVQPPPSDLTYDKPQTYTCQSASTNLNQSYTIRRKLNTSGNYFINKF